MGLDKRSAVESLTGSDDCELWRKLAELQNPWGPKNRQCATVGRSRHTHTQGAGQGHFPSDTSTCCLRNSTHTHGPSHTQTDKAAAKVAAGADAAMGVELDKWIEKVKRCEHLAEEELKALCDYVSRPHGIQGGC